MSYSIEQKQNTEIAHVGVYAKSRGINLQVGPTSYFIPFPPPKDNNGKVSVLHADSGRTVSLPVKANKSSGADAAGVDGETTKLARSKRVRVRVSV